MGILVPQADLDWLRTTLSGLLPDVALEIGSWSGTTAWEISDYAELTYCVDHWQGNTHEPDWPVGITPADAFRTFARNMGSRFLRTVIPCVGSSTFWAQIWNQPIDFLFIDGDHRYEAVRQDIDSWLPHVRDGGIIAGHDYDQPGVKKAASETFGDCFQGGTCCIWAAWKRPVLW